MGMQDFIKEDCGPKVTEVHPRMLFEVEEGRGEWWGGVGVHPTHWLRALGNVYQTRETY